MWLFAYGSLIFRPDFAFVERRRAFVDGFARRFWQGSPDHRGVPEAPGRVVTLVPSEGGVVGGAAYRLAPHDAEAILSALDAREQAGFARTSIVLLDGPRQAPFAHGITWLAASHNPHFLGPLPDDEIAAVIRMRHGPSGSNVDYVLRLRDALRALDVVDEHVEAVAAKLSQGA